LELLETTHGIYVYAETTTQLLKCKLMGASINYDYGYETWLGGNTQMISDEHGLLEMIGNLSMKLARRERVQ
jgi:hypothetical protein